MLNHSIGGIGSHFARLFLFLTHKYLYRLIDGFQLPPEIIDSLTRIYQETNGNISPLVDLHRQMKAADLTVEHVIKLLKIANNDLQSIEQKCQDLKREEAAITAKNLNAARTFQQLSNDISEEYKILDKYRSSCKEERLELARLRLQKEKLESLVKQFQNNNEDFRRIKELVNQEVRHSLTNHRHVLKLAFLSIIDSCRRDPVKFNILYYNLPPVVIMRILFTRDFY